MGTGAKINFRIKDFYWQTNIIIWLVMALSNSCKPDTSLSSHDHIEDCKAGPIIDDSVFETIHKRIYEDPSDARTRAIKMLDTLKNSDLIYNIRLLKYVGSSYVFETNYSEAIKYYDSALAIADSIKAYFEIANINNNLGVIYNETGNYKSAYVHMIEALNNYDIVKNQDKRIGALNNIGLVFLHLKNYKKALSYFDKAYQSRVVSKDSILVVTVINNIALCYLSDNKPDSALAFLGQAITFSQSINNQYGLCISYQLKGNCHVVLNQNEMAIDAYHQSIDIAQKAHLPYQLAESQIGIAQVYLKLNYTDRANNIALDVMQIADTLNSLVLKGGSHQLLSDIYEQKGDYKQSLNYYRQSVNNQQEVINQTVVNQVYDIEVDYLNQQNKMQLLELEKKELVISNKNNLLFFMAMIFALLLLGFYLLYRNFRHRQKVKLQKTIIELTEKKSNAALEAEISERKRIGQELHDSLGHLLSLAGLNASVLRSRKDLSDEKRNSLLVSLSKTIDDAFDEVRNISHNLAPSLLSEQGLKGALKNIADQVNQSARLSMSFDTYGLDGNLDAVIENTLFRTIQEIVNNTIKHARASRLFIQLTQGTDEISLMAEDDGKGFDIGQVDKDGGLGLEHLKSRIDNLNGTIDIDSAPGRGTIISIFIPLKPNPHVR
jgi:two-component system, NarL family, sensor kinase